MTTTLSDTWFMTIRHVRNLVRQPWYVAFTLMQPIIYLLLFGALFESVAELPGFGPGSYITFLLPGIVVMTALVSAGWSGMSMITDLDRGVLDRFLVSPVHRSALITGRIVSLAVSIIVQALILVGLGALRGADFDNGIVGIAVMIGSAILLAAPFGALSNGMALIMRNEESVIGAVNFIVLPLTFLASVFMAQSLMPGWMQDVARLNPLNWAVEASRAALVVNPDWGLVVTRVGYLVALGIVCSLLATRAFHAYQRSV